MRTALTILLIPLATLIASVALGQNAATSTGSGVAIGSQGEILTNSHVVENCERITVGFSSEKTESAILIARDQGNDLAVVRINSSAPSIASFREGASLRPGDMVVALGYPLSGLLATGANLSVGNVSALAGLGDDSRYLQISAPVQPGNSGGPLLDASGHVVGIVKSKLDAVRIARYTGDIPQNVNFAIKAEVAKAFLDSRRIAYRTARSDQQLSPADVGDVARPFTAYITCQQAPPRTAVQKAPVRSPVAAAVAPDTTVEARDFIWTNESLGFYQFTITNNTSHPIHDVKYVLIFYDGSGSLIHSAEGQYHGTILGNLAKTLEHSAPCQKGCLPAGIRYRTTSIEVRVLQFQLGPAAGKP